MNETFTKTVDIKQHQIPERIIQEIVNNKKMQGCFFYLIPIFRTDWSMQRSLRSQQKMVLHAKLKAMTLNAIGFPNARAN